MLKEVKLRIMKKGELSNKRSQITIFIIIAVLLVVAVSIVFLVRSSMKTGGETTPAGTENVGDFVTNCLKITAENGLIIIGRQGGYYQVSSPSILYSGNDSAPEQKYFTEFSNINVPYYLYGSSIANMPSTQTIENQISLYVQENLDNCLNDFSLFKQKGFDVTKGTIAASTRILDDKVIASLDYPVTATKGDIVQTKTAYNVDVPVRLGLIYNLTNNMILNHTACPPVTNPPNLNNDCSRIIRSNDFNIAFIRLDNTALLIFTDNKYKLNNNYYDWIFAYQYA